MSSLDDIGVAVTEITEEVLRPAWLVDMAQRSFAELQALPPSSQPTWFYLTYGDGRPS